jgi:hypothetical protein
MIMIRLQLKKLSIYFNYSLAREKELIFFINLQSQPVQKDYIRFKQLENKTDYNGLSFYIHLRANGFLQHCVLYSTDSLQKIINQNPKFYILSCTNGATYIEQPADFVELKKKNFYPLDHIDNLKLFLTPFFDPDKIRHSHANWWGLKKMWDIHHFLYGSDKQKINYPELVSSELGDIDNAAISILYDKGFISKYFYQTQRFQKIKEIKNKFQIKGVKILHIDDLGKEGWSEILFRALFTLTCAKIPEEIKDEQESSLLSVKHIDEKNLTIYRQNRNLFYSYTGFPCDENKIEDHIEKIKKIIREEGISLILLDLRLQNESKDIKSFFEISGIKVLKGVIDNGTEIISEFSGIPIILTTASNKFRTFKILQNEIDDIWIKEGIDEHVSLRSANCYFNFLQTCYNYSGKYFYLVTRFTKAIYSIQMNNNFWWLKEDINASEQFKLSIDQISSRKQEVLRLLNLIRMQLKYSFQLNSSENKVLLENYLLTIAVSIGKIIELIHRMDLIKYCEPSSILKERKDNFGYYLYSIRNISTHYIGNESPENKNDEKLSFLIERCITGIDFEKNKDFHSRFIEFDRVDYEKLLTGKNLVYYLTKYTPKGLQ